MRNVMLAVADNGSQHPSWWMLAAVVAMNMVALHMGLTTKVVPREQSPLAYMCLRMAKNTGLIIGIGGWIPAIVILMKLLNGH